MIRSIVLLLICAASVTAAADDAPCRYVGSDVTCDGESFRLLVDEIELLGAEATVLKARLEDADEDRFRAVRLEREVAAVQIKGLQREVAYWQGYAQAAAPTWWGRHRALLGYSSGVAGPAALAGGAWMLAQGGDPGLGGGCVRGGGGPRCGPPGRGARGAAALDPCRDQHGFGYSARRSSLVSAASTHETTWLLKPQVTLFEDFASRTPKATATCSSSSEKLPKNASVISPPESTSA